MICKLRLGLCLSMVVLISGKMAHETWAKIPAATSTQNAPLPKKAPPQGMVELPSGGAGRILSSRMSGTLSARKMLMALRMAVTGYFDAQPVISSAFADRGDHNLQAAFTAKLKGIPLRGIVAIQMGAGSSGQGTLVFDRATTFRRSFTNLIARVNGTSGTKGSGTAPNPVQLTMTPLLDNSGQIGLPPGWQITGSYKGTVDAVGPGGAVMGLGGYAAVVSPQVAGLYRGMPAVDFNDPVRAALDFSAFQANKARMQGLPETRVSKVWDTAPVESANGRAAYVRFSAMAGGKPYEGLGLYSIMPTDQTSGILYMSYVLAPTSIFRKALPGMVAAWESWGIKDSVFKERMDSTLQSMKETGDILTGSNARQQESYAQVNKAWDQYIRDEGTWKDPNTGQRYTGSTQVFSHNQRIGDLEPVPAE